MPLTLRLREHQSLPVDVQPLERSDRWGLSAEEISRSLIWCGNREIACGEIFDVSGSASDDQLWIFEGNCDRVKSIGRHLASGTIRVEGDVGAHLGAQMTGGEIQVTGSAGDWVGAEMRRGRIRIQGDAGHHVGAASPGSGKGMCGGEILIHGSAGNEVGSRQRRGLIAIGANAGVAAGFGMIAGTILIGGVPGIRCGAGMKRGSILLLNSTSSEPMLSTFRYSTTGRPTFLQLYFRFLRAALFPIEDDCLTARFHTFRGDMLELGKGEILRLA